MLISGVHCSNIIIGALLSLLHNSLQPDDLRLFLVHHTKTVKLTVVPYDLNNTVRLGWCSVSHKEGASGVEMSTIGKVDRCM